MANLSDIFTTAFNKGADSTDALLLEKQKEKRKLELEKAQDLLDTQRILIANEKIRKAAGIDPLPADVLLNVKDSATAKALLNSDLQNINKIQEQQRTFQDSFRQNQAQNEMKALEDQIATTKSVTPLTPEQESQIRSQGMQSIQARLLGTPAPIDQRIQQAAQSVSSPSAPTQTTSQSTVQPSPVEDFFKTPQKGGKQETVSGDIAGRVTLAAESIKNLDDAIKTLFPKGDASSFDRFTAGASNLPLPRFMGGGNAAPFSEKAQDTFRKIGASLSARQLIQTGVAARPEETAKLVQQFGPSFFSDPKAGLRGLVELQDFYYKFLKTADPNGSKLPKEVVGNLSPRIFDNEDDASNANLKKGTVIIVNGRLAKVE